MELRNDVFRQCNELWNFHIQVKPHLRCLMFRFFMLPFQESFQKCEILSCMYLTPCKYLQVTLSQYFPPPFYLRNLSELSFYALVGSCKINGVTEQQVLWQAVPKTGSEKGPGSSWLNLVADLWWGDSQDQKHYIWHFLCCTSGTSIWSHCSYSGKFKNCSV